MVNKLLLLMVFFFAISFVSAQEEDSITSLGEITQFTCVTLKQTCANCSYVNITSVASPFNKTTVLSESPMTKTGTEYNRTFCGTNTIGEYIVCGKGDPNGVTDDFCYRMNVVSGGRLVIFIMLALIAVALFLAGVWLGNPWFGFMSGAMFIVLGVYTIIYGFYGLRDFYTRSIGFVSIGLGFLFLFVSAWDWSKNHDFVESEEDEED